MEGLNLTGGFGTELDYVKALEGVKKDRTWRSDRLNARQVDVWPEAPTMEGLNLVGGFGTVHEYTKALGGGKKDRQKCREHF